MSENTTATSDAQTSTSSPDVQVNVTTGAGEVIRILGTISACAGVGLLAYALAQQGWLEIAAALVTATFFAFGRLMVSNGLITLDRPLADESDDFQETKGLLKTMYKDYQVFQKRSPIWRLFLMALGYGIIYTISMWVVRFALGVLTNMWVVGGLGALIGSVVIAPHLVGSALEHMKSKGVKVNK